MAHAVAAAKQPILAASPLSPHDIKTDFRPPTTSFSNFKGRYSTSQSPANPGRPVTTAERPRTSNGPGRRIEESRGRDTKAKDDLLISSGTAAGHITQELGTLPYNLPISAFHTPTKAREITITPRKSRTSSTSASPAPSLYRSRDTTPLGFKEHRQKLVDSRESSRHRNNSTRYDQRLPPREIAKNTQVLGGIYMAGTSLQPPQLPIGMALGSPSQAPPNFDSMAPQTRSETMPAPRKSMSGSRPPRSESLPQPQIPPQYANPTTNTISAEKPVKVSKWKLFGRFGKKSALDIAQDLERSEQAAAVEEEPIKLEVTRGKVGRSNTIKEKKSTKALRKERPGLCRVTTAPTGSSEESYTKDKTAVPFRDVHAFEESVDGMLAKAQLKSNRAHAEVREEGKSSNGLLAVDIPSIQMERYSVMFEQLLDKSTPTRKISTSNLLARRQATLDRLKTVNESIAELELEEARLGVKAPQKSRRMTSPAASPSLSLFPGHAHLTPSGAAANSAAPAQRLHRSNTSPAMLSPNRMTFPTKTQPNLPHSHSSQWTERPPVASPTSTLSSSTGPPTPDKHSKPISVASKPPSYVAQEPAWEMLESSTPKTRQRSNTTRRADTGLQSARAMAQRARANTATQRQQPPASPRTSNSSSTSNSGSLGSAQSASSSATTISSSSHQQQRPIPKIKIRHKPSLEPYPSGIVPGIPSGGMVRVHPSACTSILDISSSGSSTLRESAAAAMPIQHPKRGSSRHQLPEPSPHLQSQADLVKGMKIPVSRFSTAPARRLPVEREKEMVGDVEEEEGDECEGGIGVPGGMEREELMIRTAADVSIARQISISRQQSQMLKQRLARGERRRMEGKGIDDREKERGERLGRRGEKEREIRHAIDDRGGLLQSQQRGLMPMIVDGEANRKSEYVILEGE